MSGAGDPHEVRLGELVATFALGQDNAFGQPLESQLRACLIATWLAEAMGVSDAERATVHWVAQLRFLGCTGHAHEVAAVFGDEIDTRARSLLYDPANTSEVLRDVLRHAGRDRNGMERFLALVSVLATSRSFAEMNFRTGCEVADMFADRLRMTSAVRDSLSFTFERWNGKGLPNGARGQAIPLPMRIVHLSQEMEVLERVQGPAEARKQARKRANKAYDPEIVDVYLTMADEISLRLEKVDPWDESLAGEPSPHRMLRGAALDEALLVAADFIDIKSPFTAGHSRGVADLAAAAATDLGLADADVTATRRAAWVHDFGRTAVPNSIWDKPSSLTRSERDRVELHPLLTEQMLRRTPGLNALNPIAACHHERADGSGYCKGLAGSALSPAAHVVAVADCYHAMTEDRAHRPAMSARRAATEVRQMAAAGHLDGDAARAVLVAAGHTEPKRRRTFPAGLTAREVEVLQLVAQGLTTKQIAAHLTITAKTADHHIQHVYGKIGVSTRGAAALFAIQHDLVRPPPATTAGDAPSGGVGAS